MDQKDIEKIISEVITSLATNKISQQNSQNSDTNKLTNKLTTSDYPLAEKRKDLIRTPTNKKLDDITLDAVLNNNITAEDVRITPETLELQAQIAENAGRKTFALNLRRAAELTRIPDARILEIYNAMRPNRSTKKQLLDISKELKDKYQAFIVSGLVAEAAEVYETRNILKNE